ncbi:hypothetical protein [Streptomyces phage phiSAJS1]|uniref:hypothetical protein n=1 Tax=Streptomyces phage phiSAJS1 TaxID=1755682 RepID=UPI00071EF882|nr:hypothetical protein AVT91_p04 [Streptomyces phage phiSAJS1]ALO79413.1 hypothetical protein [Streptomyces phage phiSAJS1]
MAYTANNPAAVSVIIDVLASMGLVAGDAQDIRDDRPLDAMVAVRRSGAVNVVGLNDKADERMTEYADLISFKSNVAGATFGLTTVSGFPVLVCS